MALNLVVGSMDTGIPRCLQRVSIRTMRRSWSRLSTFVRSPGVNELYIPDARPQLVDLGRSESSKPGVTTMEAADPRHWSDEEWSAADIRHAAEEHALFTWGASEPSLSWAPTIVRGDGIYLYDDAGKEYIDWTSQAVCSNLGHTVPPAVRDAVIRQMEAIPFVYGGLGVTPIRAKLAQLLAEVCPGDINGFLFPSSGGEANEAAVRVARRFSGKHKILSRYRSYHGGSASTLTMTGDPRRWMAETGVGGFVHMFDPQPFTFSWGSDVKEVVERSLAAMEEQIMYESPSTIAAVFLESIPGSGGVLLPPEGYLEGVRALCDKYNILLILDEVREWNKLVAKDWEGAGCAVSACAHAMSPFLLLLDECTNSNSSLFVYLFSACAYGIVYDVMYEHCMYVHCCRCHFCFYK